MLISTSSKSPYVRFYRNLTGAPVLVTVEVEPQTGRQVKLVGGGGDPTVGDGDRAEVFSLIVGAEGALKLKSVDEEPVSATVTVRSVTRLTA